MTINRQRTPFLIRWGALFAFTTAFATAFVTATCASAQTNSADGTSDQTELQTKVRTLAAALWQTAQADYQVCKDFSSCYASSCTPGQDIQARAASRPFVMPAAGSTTPGSCQGKKGTVLLIHGFQNSPYNFGAMAESLTTQGYNVVTVLLSGHGATYNPTSSCSGMTKENWENDVDKAAKLADDTFPGCPLIIGGHSTGGALAVDYIQRHQSDLPGKPGDPNRPPPKAIASVLFDPALELPTNSERALRAENAKDKSVIDNADMLIGKVVYGSANPAKDDTNPARVPAAAVCASALENVNLAIRKFAKMNASQGLLTPTFAAFSNGLGQSGSKTIESAASRTLLTKGLYHTPALLSSTAGNQILQPDLSIGHNPLILKSDIGICKFNGLNPRFEQMMTDPINGAIPFLNRQVDLAKAAWKTGPAQKTSQ